MEEKNVNMIEDDSVICTEVDTIGDGDVHDSESSTSSSGKLGTAIVGFVVGGLTAFAIHKAAPFIKKRREERKVMKRARDLYRQQCTAEAKSEDNCDSE